MLRHQPAVQRRARVAARRTGRRGWNGWRRAVRFGRNLTARRRRLFRPGQPVCPHRELLGRPGQRPHRERPRRHADEHRPVARAFAGHDDQLARLAREPRRGHRHRRPLAGRRQIPWERIRGDQCDDPRRLPGVAGNQRRKVSHARPSRTVDPGVTSHSSSHCSRSENGLARCRERVARLPFGHEVGCGHSGTLLRGGTRRTENSVRRPWRGRPRLRPRRPAPRATCAPPARCSR